MTISNRIFASLACFWDVGWLLLYRGRTATGSCMDCGTAQVKPRTPAAVKGAQTTRNPTERLLFYTRHAVQVLVALWRLSPCYMTRATFLRGVLSLSTSPSPPGGLLLEGALLSNMRARTMCLCWICIQQGVRSSPVWVIQTDSVLPPQMIVRLSSFTSPKFALDLFWFGTFITSLTSHPPLSSRLIASHTRQRTSSGNSPAFGVLAGRRASGHADCSPRRKAQLQSRRFDRV